MVTDILQTSSVQRLASILLSRYGKGLEVRYVVDATSDQWLGNGLSVSGGDLYIPISAKGTFLGLARVPHVEGLSENSIEAIAQIVRLVLEPALYRRLLDSRIEGLLAQPTTSESMEGSKPQFAPSTLPKAILLTSQKDSLIHQSALSIHEQTESWAFLRYSDLGNTLGDVRSLCALGRATILIPDVESLTSENWISLKDYLISDPSNSTPLIVLGSKHSWLELRNSGDVDHDILDILSSYTAELDRWPTNKKLFAEAFLLLLKPASETLSC